MKRAFIAAIAALATALTVDNAQAVPATQASVETLFAVMRTESMIDTMYGSVEQMVRQNILQASQGKVTTPDQQRLVDTVIPRVVNLMHEEMNWEKLKPQYIQLYCSTFEQEEVDGLIAFYASPTGQAFVDKMPVVMQKSMALSQTMMHSMMPKLLEVMKQSMLESMPGH